MTELDLVRFLDAQAPIYSRVVDELTEGRKRTHWMWFIFPQIAGLGQSAVAQHFAIRDLDEAKRYLADSTLGPRLRECVRLMLNHRGKLALEILGSPDDLKFRSCLALFRQAASEDSDRGLFTEALNQFYRVVAKRMPEPGAARLICPRQHVTNRCRVPMCRLHLFGFHGH